MGVFNPKVIKVILITGLLMVFAALLVHESGHLFAGLMLGGSVSQIIILGIQFVPTFEIVGFSGGFLGYVGTEYSYLTQTGEGFFTMMGSGSTLIMAALFVFLLYAIRPQGLIAKTILVYGSLWYLDIVTYTFGLRFSGRKEPLEAAALFGIPEMLWYLFIIIVFLSFNFALVYYFLFINPNKDGRPSFELP